MAMFSARPIAGQVADSLPPTLFMPVGSSAENYVRYMQTLGLVDLTQWTIRPVSPRSLALLLEGGAVRSHFDRDRPVHRTGGFIWQVLPISGSFWYNSTYPFGWNDGAVWRGRGVTAAAEGGVAVRWKALSATVDPSGFLAENRAFPLIPISSTATTPFADVQFFNIDRPQRFGNKSYGQLSGGQTTIRIDALGMTAGVSTANQWIGPMSEWPFLLGNNAGGFPHFFAGSSSPWNVGIGTIHGRIFYGGLSQSAYMSNPDTISGRLISGVQGSFSPRFLRGLEIGAGRIFEYAWPTRGFGSRDFRKPLESFLKEHVPPDPGLHVNQSADNQLASVFARWVLPSSGFEVYGEFGRDDHNWNGRDAILEPDHDATYGLGLRKAWLGDNGATIGLRCEIFNMETSTLARARAQGMVYGHTYSRQGHTEMGQILGAGFAAISGGGSMLQVDRFLPNGEQASVSLTRMVTREQNAEPSVDLQYALAAERTRRIASLHVSYGVTGVYNVNRYFAADVGNVMLSASLRW
jgi:hypothetical protein